MCSVIGPENLCDPLNKSDSKLVRDLVTFISPRLTQLVCFYLEFSLANNDIDHSMDWLITLSLVFQLRTALRLMYRISSWLLSIVCHLH